jgi:exodeoxyribonuclease V gamma subunit
MNLAKDSEIYPSPIINDLKNFVAGFAEKQKDESSGKELEPLHTEIIPLDETRSKDCLFTRRGRRYLESIECIRANASDTSKAPDVKKSSDSSDTKGPDKVLISQMKQYLNDPFQFYIGRMLRLEKIENDPTEEYVEPISLSNLDEAIFLKQAVYIERGLDKDYESVDVYFDGLKSQGYIPSGKFGEGMSDKIKTRADAIKVELDSFFPENAYTCKSIELNECITDPDGSNSDSKRLEFMLQGNIPLVFSSKEKCAIVSVSNSDGLGAYKYLDSYIGALGLIAAGKAESVDLFIATGACQDDDAYEANVCRISKSPSEAMKTLCDIYKKAFKEQDNKILPISLLCSNITNTDYLKAKLVNDHGGAWMYFAGKDLFINELEKYSGYSNKSFADEWAKACEKQKDLLGELNNKIEGAV